MDDYDSAKLLERNPVTHARHRQEVLWQITIPIVVGVIILLAIAVLAIVLGSQVDHSQWADVSLIWLILPAMLGAFILFVTIAAVAYGVMRLVGVLPHYALRLQDFFVLLSFQLGKLDDKAVEPILRLKAFMASVEALGRQFRGGSAPHNPK